MKDQTELRTISIAISTGQDTGSSAFNPAGAQAPIFFAEDDFTQELADGAYKISLSCGPGTSLSPEINPEEFESVYLWYIS